MKKLLLSAAAALLALGASAALPKDVRIYINPGHGSWGGEDRHMGTVTHGGPTYTDTAGFYESNTNLEKGFGMLEKLIEYGVPFDRTKNQNNSNPARLGAALDLSQTNLVMSRVKNGPYPHDGSTYGAYSRNLSEIAAECESWNADIMISIHSNAATEGTTTNYPLFLYRGYTNSEQNAGSSAAAKACWPHWWKNQHMMWTYYSATNMNIQGDWTFMSSWGTQGYGILRHSVPGFLVEGYFHTYQPARHKAMNWDACRWEGQRYAKGFNDYFGWGKKDNYGTVFGVLRDGEQTFTHTYYTPNSSTLDKFKPINNATVTLKNGNGEVVKTYKTDDEYNGVFVFDKVPAGTYSLTYSHPEYREFSQSVTVTANETTFPTPLFETEQIPARGHYAYGLSSSNSGSNYTLKFKSTGDVDNASIIFTNNSTGATQSIKTGAIKKGENTVTVDSKTLGENATFSWSVAINNPVSTGVELLYSDNSIVYNNGSANARIGVAIDKDPTSANFGTIYTLTAMGQGLQKYNPDFSKNGGKVITGMFGKDTDASTSSNKFYRSNRLEVNKGKVYIANYANNYTGIWEYDPITNSTPKNLSGTTYYERAVAIVGEGSSRKVFTSHENNLQRFDIGTGTTWTSGSPAKSYTTAGIMDNGDGDVLVTDNAVIVSQNRYAGNNLAQNPAFAVLDHNLNLISKSDVINSTLNGSENGGMAITADKKTFAIANSYTSSGNSGIIIQVYDVTWNGSTPTFVHKHTIPLDGTYRVDQMEFDHADNLYIASQQKGLLVYAIKNPARQTVTKATSTIQGQAVPAVRGHYAYDLKMSKNENTYTLTFKSTGDVASANVVLTPSEGEATTIKIDAVKAGENTVEIDATTLNAGVKYNWSIALDNPASPSVEQYFSDNSIIYNNGSNDARIGVAIDNDPASANFGNIYTLTAMGQGMQRYNPDYSKNGGKVVTGMFGKDTDASTSTNKFVRSNRIEVENGKVYIANYANMNSGMWEYDPTTNASPRNITNVYYERALAFYGEGSSRKVFSSHENNLQRFDIGTITSWTSGSPVKSYTAAGIMDNGDGDVLVTDKAVIVSQNRFAGNNLTQNPAFAVFDHDLNLKFRSDAINATLNGSDKGGMAISADYKTFAIADSYTGSGRSGVSVQVYSVTWNGATPTFTHKYAIPLDGTKVVDQMEFDYAGNLLVASQQKGLLAFAIKTDARTTTTNADAALIIEGVEAIKPLYITGANVGGNWDPANAAEFEFNGEDYSITLDETASEFKISTSKGSWDEFNAGNLTPDAAIENGKTVNLSVNKDGGNIILPWAGVWTVTVAGDFSTLTASTETPEPAPEYPAAIYMVGYNGAWDPETPTEISGENGVYSAKDVEFTNTEFKLSTAKGTWDEFNAGVYGVESTPIEIGAEVALKKGYSNNITIATAGTYDVVVNLENMTLTLNGVVNYPEVIYAIGDVNGLSWATSEGVAFDHKGDGIYEGSLFVDNSDNGYGYFQFATTLGADWDAVNAGTRYGATENNQLVEPNIAYNMTNNWAGGTQSWKCAEGKCNIQVDVVNCTMTILEFTGIEGISIENNGSDVYYNLQGMKVDNPQNGLYIKVNGTKASRVYVK